MNEMRSLKVFIIGVFISILFIGANINNTLAITGQSSGYVQYNVIIAGIDDFTLPKNFVVNESVVPGDQAGFVDVTLSLTSEITNFTFSKSLNASSFPMIFPYFLGLTNQSFSYAVQGTSITASLVRVGKIPVTFNEIAYEATEYLVTFSVVNSSSMKSISANGNIVSMPSGLIYAIELSFNQTSSVEIMLISTDLVLNHTSSSVDPLGAAILGGGAIFAIVIAVPTIFKKIRRNNAIHLTQSKEKEATQENGMEPACVKACPTDALVYGEREALIAEAEERISNRPGKYVNHIYGKEEAGGTSWMYLSPVSFKDLGFPDLGPEPVPELSEALAVYGTPSMLVGVTAVLGGLYWFTKRRAEGMAKQGKEE